MAVKLAGGDPCPARAGRDGRDSSLWLLGHMARGDDVEVNLVVAAGRRVLDTGWTSRLGVSPRLGETGTIRSLAGLALGI